MVVATVSLAAVLAGVFSAARAARQQSAARIRSERLGGGLLASGLMLLGAGLHSAMS